MGPPSYMRSVVDRNIIIRRILVNAINEEESFLRYFGNRIQKFKNEIKLTFQTTFVSSVAFNIKKSSNYIKILFKCVVRISQYTEFSVPKKPLNGWFLKYRRCCV